MNIKPELSTKNKYWVERHRYYELKYFCLQYPTWKRYLRELEDSCVVSQSSGIFSERTISDPTQKCILAREYYREKMQMIEGCVIAADSSLYPYILKSVTEGLSYNTLKARFNIPCGRDMFYDRYRKFFWILNSSRK